jgi:diguanylate cyclase
MLNRILPDEHRPLLYILLSLFAGLVVAVVLTTADGLTVLSSHIVSAYGGEPAHFHPLGVLSLALLTGTMVTPVVLAIIHYGRHLPGVGGLADRLSVRWRMARLERDVAQALAAVLKGSSGHDVYFRALHDARVSLDELPAPEQIKIIVSMLVTENDRARSEVLNTNAALEENLTSICKLTADIAVAEAVASSDSLTGLGNRRYFDRHLAASVADAKISGRPCSLILSDLDHFKVINDTFGHLLGDDVLRVFSEVLKSCLRPSDRVARYGGEEFAVVLPDTRLQDAQLAAERMRKAVEAKRFKVKQTGQGIGTLTASFGVVQLEANEDGTLFLARADKLLYQAKSRGRNKVVW